jgi:hypothetical protein
MSSVWGNEYMSTVEHRTQIMTTVLYFRAKLLKSYPNSRKSSPSRTPLKRGQDKYRSFLEVKLRSDKKTADDEVLCVNEKDARPTSLPVSLEESNETSV